MNRRKFLKTTSAAALTAVAGTGAATATESLDGGAGTYSDCEDCWDSGGSYDECCGPYGPCTDCAMK